MYSKNTAKCSPKTMQNKEHNEWKLYSSTKCSPKIMQNVVKNEWKRWSKDNAKCNQDLMERENHCKM